MEDLKRRTFIRNSFLAGAGITLTVPEIFNKTESKLSVESGVQKKLSAKKIIVAGAGISDISLFLRVTIVNLADLVLYIYLFALFLYALTSFVSPGGYAPGVRLLSQLCEPILKPVRRIIPPIGQIDFSVLWVSIVIGALLVLLR